MDDELRRLLLENIRLARENNQILRKLKRSDNIRTIVTAVYWLVLILVPLYLYYTYVAPTLLELNETYSNIRENTQQLNDGQVPESFQGLIDRFFPGEKATTTEE